MANWKKISLLGAIILVIGLGAAVVMRPKPRLEPVAPAPKMNVAEKDLVLKGRAYCSLTTAVACPMAAKVAENFVVVGQEVKQGQQLLKLTLLPPDAAAMILRANKGPAILAQELLIKQLELKINQLDRSILEAQKLAEVNLAPKNSLPDLLEQKAVAASQLANARVDLADTRCTAAEDLNVLSDLLGYTVTSGSQPRSVIVRAKQDGYIISIEPSVTPGATVAGKVMTIGVMNPMVIRGQVHESDIGRLKAGETASITLDSDKQEPAMNATLTSVSWAAQDNNLTSPSYYLFELNVPNPGLIIRDGNKVKVTFKAQKPASPEVQPEPQQPEPAKPTQTPAAKSVPRATPSPAPAAPTAAPPPPR